MIPLARLLDLRGQHALVTGAALGIGRSVVGRLLEAGARVTVVDLAPQPADLTHEALAWERADVRDAVAAERVVGGMTDLSILVNNAGAYPLIAWNDLDGAAWSESMEINLSSVAHYCRLAGARMGSPGAIVNVSSVAGVRPVPMLLHYGVAKAAVRQLTRALAVELGPAGIRVNTVTPGGIPTEGAAAARVEAVKMPEVYRPRRPLGDGGTPEDIANAVLYLVSPMSAYVTGAELVVDGGFLAT